jgi:hypothetical protein
VGWRDRTLGIVLGVALGAGIVVAFVFVFSERTVDAPSLSEGPAPDPERGGEAEGKPGASRPGAPPVATVRVIGGAPPPRGPAELHYRQGAEVRLRVVSDRTVDLELTGYGLDTLVPAGAPTTIEFKASRAGTFALIVADSHIDVARIAVSGRDRQG